ncbi:hypothetical protein Y032_0001g481 [Ancylostoma ceylanicum]|uniref:Phospholipase B-like n=1 Tax=Ancylostoma ceylanicum TaxID=53326 RepID=A0A016W6H4_9BILA|nr:hypothetical protein Y032_0001g481 [Ancylostoma ceylanicum]
MQLGHNFALLSFHCGAWKEQRYYCRAVLDYNKFTPNKPLPEYGLFYVLEQMPGTVVYQDMTWFLQRYSYFPSYNIPYFKKITQISGFVGQGKKLGNWFVWGKSPRARIFERDHHTVTDLDSLTKLMRYNDYTKDEFSKCNCNPPYSAEAAISARGDLNPANGTYEFPGQGHVNHGALDYKGTNVSMMKKLEFRAQGGPTWGTVPPFKWSTFDFVSNVLTTNQILCRRLNTFLLEIERVLITT